MSVLRFIFVTSASLAVLNISWRECLQALKGGMVAMLISGPAVLICDQLMSFWPKFPSVRLALDVLTGAVAFMLVLHCAPRQILSKEMGWLWERVTSHVSGSMAGFLKRVIPLEGAVVRN